jgi:hypothetical protein
MILIYQFNVSNKKGMILVLGISVFILKSMDRIKQYYNYYIRQQVPIKCVKEGHTGLHHVVDTSTCEMYVAKECTGYMNKQALKPWEPYHAYHIYENPQEYQEYMKQALQACKKQ